MSELNAAKRPASDRAPANADRLPAREPVTPRTVSGPTAVPGNRFTDPEFGSVRTRGLAGLPGGTEVVAEGHGAPPRSGASS